MDRLDTLEISPVPNENCLVTLRDRLLSQLAISQSRLTFIELRAMILHLEDIWKLHKMYSEPHAPILDIDDVTTDTDASKFHGSTIYSGTHRDIANILLANLGITTTIEQMYAATGYHMLDQQGITTDIPGVSLFILGNPRDMIIGLQFTKEVKASIVALPSFSPNVPEL